MSAAAAGEYPWHAQAWRHLCALREAGCLPPALLLKGMPGSGVEGLARRFLSWLLCREPGQERACGVCPACRQEAAGVHPGALRLAPSGKSDTIGVDDIRRVLEHMDLRTPGKELRVLLISPAESMNKAASHALLKMLEEPGEGKHFLLAARLPGRLPATVRSRCVQLPCGMPAAALAQSWLAEGLGDEETAQRCLRIAAGAPLAARELAQGEGLQQWESFRESLQDWLAGKRTLSNVAAVWQKIMPEQLLVWQMIVALELARQALGEAPPRLEELARLCRRPVSVAAVFRLLDELRRHRQRVLEGVSASAPLWLEDIALRWRGVFPAAAQLA